MTTENSSAIQPADSTRKPRGKPGAPPKNRNRTLHGVKGWLSIGSLPKGASFIRRMQGRMRTELENTLLAKHGKIVPYQAALVSSACRHEGRAQLAQRWLRLEAEKLSLAERRQLLQDITDATDSRDKCIEKLGLTLVGQKDSESDPWAALHAESTVPDSRSANGSPVGGEGAETTKDTQNASDATDTPLGGMKA